MSAYRRPHRLLVLALAAALTAPLGSVRAEDDTALDDAALDGALAYWKRRHDTPALSLRWRGMRKLAKTRSAQGRDLLIKRYARPRDPKDHERYLIASLLGQYLRGADDLEALERMIGKHKADGDAWLWHHVLSNAVRLGEQEWVFQHALNERLGIFQRMAALEALARSHDRKALDAVDALLPTVAKQKAFERARIVESAARAVYDFRSEAKSERYQRTGMALVATLRDADLSDATRLTVARHLARAFDVERLTLSPSYWEAVIAQQRIDDTEAETVSRPRFGGVEATGTRLAYLIDMSDSMLRKVSARLVTRLQAAGDLPEDLEGRRVTNRFELARELLRTSLAQLPKDASFVVVGFGSEARYLDATPRMRAATQGTIRKTMRQLDAIKASGALWDATNLHGAFRKAFMAVAGRPLERDEHVAAKAFASGVDTVFVLSDGDPTYCDFSTWDMSEPDTEKGDAERGGMQGLDKPERLNMWGPYRSAVTLRRDLRRLNLFRKVEIQCIGIGEAEKDTLEKIAAIGLGRVRMIK